jgi:hypothetical protein
LRTQGLIREEKVKRKRMEGKLKTLRRRFKGC